MDGARAQRTGRAHLRVPVDEMIFASFYQLWAAGDPQGRLVGERRFSLVFAPFQKVTRRARDWLRNTAGMPSLFGKTIQQARVAG